VKITVIILFKNNEDKINRTSKIIRTWRGWTTKENASICEDMLINELFPTIKKNGLEKVSISTKFINDEGEFFLVLQFDSLVL
jgi:hypothetical protein